VNYEKRIQRRRDMKQQVLDKIKAVRVAKVTPVVVTKVADKKKAAPVPAPKKK
jgi:predicted nucleic acid-binding Zn ribbon protein